VRCPFCKEDKDKVIDSRSSDAGRVIRRRRQCLACKRRFTTYEKTGDSIKLHVVKRTSLACRMIGQDHHRLAEGLLQTAGLSRAGSADRRQDRGGHLPRFDREVTSTFIGECVMKHLRDVDKVAYIRFASVYREFKDAGELIEEVTRAIQESDPADQLKLFDA